MQRFNFKRFSCLAQCFFTFWFFYDTWIFMNLHSGCWVDIWITPSESSLPVAATLSSASSSTGKFTVDFPLWIVLQWIEQIITKVIRSIVCSSFLISAFLLLCVNMIFFDLNVSSPISSNQLSFKHKIYFSIFTSMVQWFGYFKARLEPKTCPPQTMGRRLHE